MSHRKSRIPFALLLAWLFSATIARAQEAPTDVSLCELKRHPESFNKKSLRVRGTLSVHFEDFTLGGENCQTEQEIWLAFGGDVPGLVTSMANDNIRKPGVDVAVEGVPYGIKKDENFRRLYALISAREGENPKYRVTATLAGTFFAGEKRESATAKTRYGGYGHLGCCSLFIITAVTRAESIPSANLSVRGIVIGPDGKPMRGLAVVDDILGGSPPERQQVLTNAKGEFEFAISGQQLRIEDPKYRPVALTVEPGGAPVQIKLEDATFSDWHVPTCAEDDKLKRTGFSALFAIPPRMDSSLNETEGAKSYFVFPSGKDSLAAELFISTFPDKIYDVADSVGSEKFRQRWVKDTVGNIIGIDSRGQGAGGGDWRTVSFLDHDLVDYRLTSRKPHKTLDRIIDSACIGKH